MMKRGWKYLTQEHADVLEKLCKDGNATAINTYGKECTYVGTSNGTMVGILIGAAVYGVVDICVTAIRSHRKKVMFIKDIEESAKRKK